MGGRMGERWACGKRDDPLQGGVGFEFEVAILAAERKAGRQVAIGTGKAHGKRIALRIERALREVAQGQKDLGAFIVGAFGRTAFGELVVRPAFRGRGDRSRRARS